MGVHEVFNADLDEKGLIRRQIYSEQMFVRVVAWMVTFSDLKNKTKLEETRAVWERSSMPHSSTPLPVLSFSLTFTHAS